MNVRIILNDLVKVFENYWLTLKKRTYLVPKNVHLEYVEILFENTSNFKK